MTTGNFIPLRTLERITKNFSDHSRIGRGGYGDVYKGLYNEREIAVKLLHVDTLQGLDDKQFRNEVVNLLEVNHPNIVQFVGYCYEIRKLLVKHDGSDHFSERIYRVICFEYLQDGSLDKHLKGKSFAPNWSTRYSIIKGICEGLKFLHNRENPILHLDLKPANILLDSSMVPKVADFGLSRLFSGSHTHVTERIAGTKKYMPPESSKGMISVKNDVFSFGVVMIEIMIGSSDQSNSIEMDDVPQIMQKAFKNCSNLIEDKTLYREAELGQVQKCISIATSCVHPERNSRPTMADILVTLNKTEIHIPKRPSKDVLLCPTIGPKSTMAKRLSLESTSEVHHIATKRRRSNFNPGNNSNINVEQGSDRETTSEMGQELIIGRAEEKQKILFTLSEGIKEETIILPIYGIGGIGKTTLARLVFNDPQFHEYCPVWVYVSRAFDLKKIGNSIISQLKGKPTYIADKQMRHTQIRKLFTGKSILIVLDDLWEENPWKINDLMTMLKLGARRTVVVIVTTRDEAIAKMVCGPAVTPCKLEILTDDMCWTIIKGKTAFETRPDKKQLEHIGMAIAAKCGGVALAAKSLGYTLSGMKKSYWESMRDNHIWNLSTSEGSSPRNHEVLASLELSYSQMSDWLKLCFSYCAVFQKGHNIVKDDLIHQWIAHGFPERSIFDSMQLCEEYISQLLGMSFLEYSEGPLSDEEEKKAVTVFKMHDLVHDLARVMLADKVNKKGNLVESSCHYALLTDCSKRLKLSVASPTNLKALHFLDCYRIKLRGGAFSSAKCLLVLDLSECIITNLPDSICRLKQLRFLHAPRIHNRLSYCIALLSELTYLNLSGSCNITLPESIGNLKGLMHLDLSGCDGMYQLPASFAELKQLVHLDLSRCYVSTSDAFGGFTKLQYLNLCFFKFYEVEEKKFIPDRRGLTKVISNLIELRYLNLSACRDTMTSSEDEIGSLLDSISKLSNLEHFDFSYNRFSNIPESIGNLCMLHTLDLSGCDDLKKLPDRMYEMVSLKVLNLKGVKLDESVLSRLNIASLPKFLVLASSHEGSSNISLLQPTNPDNLEILKLENVRSPEEAQDIKLKQKLKMKRLFFEWTTGAERFVDDKEVLEKLVPPTSVEKLSIEGYMCVSLPDWLMGIRHYLPNLCRLDLTDFPMCDNLPLLGQLPNLESLRLYSMGSLEEWNTEYTNCEEDANELIFPKLRKLVIDECPRLRIKPCLPRALLVLKIIDCDVHNLLSCGESSSHSGAFQVTNLHVKDSKVATALRKLTISGCSLLTTPIETIQHVESLCLQSLSPNQKELLSWLLELKFLHELELKSCRIISLPEWLGELTSLKRFSILYCNYIWFLPDSIQKLTKLEDLYIQDCPILEQWCKTMENKMKLAHIKRVITMGDEEDEDDDAFLEAMSEDISVESSFCRETSDDSGETSDDSDEEENEDGPSIEPSLGLDKKLKEVSGHREERETTSARPQRGETYYTGEAATRREEGRAVCATRSTTHPEAKRVRVDFTEERVTGDMHTLEDHPVPGLPREPEEQAKRRRLEGEWGRSEGHTQARPNSFSMINTTPERVELVQDALPGRPEVGIPTEDIADESPDDSYEEDISHSMSLLQIL